MIPILITAALAVLVWSPNGAAADVAAGVAILLLVVAMRRSGR